MADEQELEMEEGAKKGNKMMLIIIVAVILIGGGAAAFFLMGGSDDAGSSAVGEGASTEQQVADEQGGELTTTGAAQYVPMPRPFVFNVPGSTRERLVQIKVQLMVRGSGNAELARMHIPLIEGALLQVFSSTNADELATELGKSRLKEVAVKEVQAAMQEIAGNKVVEQVLFTGFVMQ